MGFFFYCPFIWAIFMDAVINICVINHENSII